mmetsp:Transcript_23706/g.21068  ORF Transcript_23706/g.21068 Transcript_23706/m.21068 type:complete len:100 (-) Transcript_23706:6-305(-)
MISEILENNNLKQNQDIIQTHIQNSLPKQIEQNKLLSELKDKIGRKNRKVLQPVHEMDEEHSYHSSDDDIDDKDDKDVIEDQRQPGILFSSKYLHNNKL